jgi:predicted nucleotidyltransferase
MIDTAKLQNRLLAHPLPDVQLVVLFGSQVKGQATTKSDWDIAVLSAPDAYKDIQQFALQQAIAHVLSIPFDKIDLIDLRYCPPLLAFAVAREGCPLYEASPSAFRLFQVKASQIYADAAIFRQLQRVYLGYETEEIKQ